MPGIDVHQHLWPPQLVAALRARRAAPYLTGWTLHTGTEAPFEVDAADLRRRHRSRMRRLAPSPRHSRSLQQVI